MMLKYRMIISSLIVAIITCSGTSRAHNNVVVIPVAGEDVEIGIHLDRTQIVGGSGSGSENGAALVAAVAFVNSQSATADDPWLIKLEPGTYDIGSAEMELSDYVSLQGAGMRITKIISSTTGEILRPGSGAQVSELWIDSTHAGSNDADCIYIELLDGVVVRNVKLTNAGIQADGIDVLNSTNILLSGLEITATDFGVFISGGSNAGVIIRDSHITSTGDEAFNAGNNGDESVVENTTLISMGSNTSAMNSFGGSTVIRHSSLISTSGGSVNNSQASSTIEIYNSFVDVDDSFATHFTAGTAICSGIATPSSFSTTTCL